MLRAALKHGPLCIQNRTHTPPRPRFGPFLWTARHSNHLPSTFWACFVDGNAVDEAGWNSRLADKYLGVNGL